jgi:hypothetical protein
VIDMLTLRIADVNVCTKTFVKLIVIHLLPEKYIVSASNLAPILIKAKFQECCVMKTNTNGMYTFLGEYFCIHYGNFEIF